MRRTPLLAWFVLLLGVGGLYAGAARVYVQAAWDRLPEPPLPVEHVVPPPSPSVVRAELPTEWSPADGPLTVTLTVAGPLPVDGVEVNVVLTTEDATEIGRATTRLDGLRTPRVLSLDAPAGIPSAAQTVHVVLRSDQDVRWEPTDRWQVQLKKPPVVIVEITPKTPPRQTPPRDPVPMKKPAPRPVDPPPTPARLLVLLLDTDASQVPADAEFPGQLVAFSKQHCHELARGGVVVVRPFGSEVVGDAPPRLGVAGNTFTENDFKTIADRVVAVLDADDGTCPVAVVWPAALMPNARGGVARPSRSRPLDVLLWWDKQRANPAPAVVVAWVADRGDVFVVYRGKYVFDKLEKHFRQR